VKLAVNLGYWDATSAGSVNDLLKLAVEAERLGYASAWAAEAYGSDAVTVLSWVAGQTSRIELGSGVLQIPARTPAMTAMTAATLDMLSGGRFLLGLGVSGPQVSEGWHGVRFGKPLARTREYVEIVNLALSRRRVRYEGEHYVLPLPDGPGKALHLMVHPVRDHVPLYLAAIGPKNLELTGEIADGWLGVLVSSDHAGDQLAHIAAGRERVGRDMTGFDVCAYVPLSVGEDVTACAVPVRPYTALYVGGMGSREQNFYNNLAVRMGYGEQAAVVQDRYLARDYDGAAAAVPAELVDQTSLLGPVPRVAERIAAFAAAGVTTLAVTPYGDTLEARLRTLQAGAEALERSGVAAGAA
jgi:F420-dependent oxidoreductase-like protein